jgi:hypothetical protein
MEGIYLRYRKKIVDRFPFLKFLKKYKIIIPKIKALILWKIIKPKKIKYLDKIFFTSVNSFSDPSRNLYAYGDHYETDERKIIEKNISEGDNCIDIGANIGFYTWWFLRCSKFRGNVYSFECLNDVYEILKKNFFSEKNIKVFKGFVGINKSGEHIVPDNFITDKISFIKIDIDGPDYFALKACENIIDRDSPKIIVELCENSERNWDVHYSKVLNFLKNKNYKCYNIKQMGEEFNRKLEYDEIVNIFAIK